jgi:hypothetical protein
MNTNRTGLGSEWVTAAKLGATVAYQELDRTALEGLVTMQSNGELSLTAAAESPTCLERIAPNLIQIECNSRQASRWECCELRSFR